MREQRASLEADGADRGAVLAARHGASAGPDSGKALTSPAPVGSSPHAARPNTPATADSRTVYRSPSAVASRSVDLSSVSGSGPPVLPPRPERTATAPNLGMVDLDSMDPRVVGSSLVPQPPPSGSPAVSGNSPRLRTATSRSLPVKVSRALSPSVAAGDAEDTADTPELYLSQSPKLGSATCPLTPDTAQSPLLEPAATRSSGRPPTLPVPQPSYSTALSSGVSPAGTPGSARGAPPRQSGPPASAAAAAAAAVSPVSVSGAEGKADPWVELRAHCVAAYGGDASSGEESDGGGPGGDAGRLMLMRHPSLLTRSLSRSFGEVAAAAPTPNTTPASGPASASVSARRLSPADKHPTSATAPSAASIAAATAAAGGAAAATATALAVVSAVPVGRAKVSSVVASSAASVAAAAPVGAVGAAAGSGLSTRHTPGASAAAIAGAIPGATAAAAPAVASLRSAAASPSGAAPDLSGATLARARMAAAATLQLQPQQHQRQQQQQQLHHLQPHPQRTGQLTGGAAPGRAPLPPLPPPSPSGSLSPRASTEAPPGPHRSESGTISTVGAVPAAMQGTPPRSRRNSAAGGGGGSLRTSMEASPFATAAANMLEGMSYPSGPTSAPSPSRSPLHRPPQPPGAAARGSSPRGSVPPTDVGGMSSLGSAAAMAMAALEEQLHEQLLLEVTSGGAGAGGGDRRVSESGGVGLVAGSILDAPPLNADPVRKRRLSADGLSRHASKYIGGGGGHGSTDGAAPPAAAAVAAVAPAAAVATPADSSPALTLPKSVTVDGSVGSAAAAAGGGVGISVGGNGGGGVGGGPSLTVTSPGAPLSTGSSPSSGRVPLITALTFEKAPWSASPAGGAAGHHGAASSPAAGLPGDGAIAAKALLWPQSPSLPRALGVPPQRPYPVLPFDRVSPDAVPVPAAAAAAVTAVDKLRGYKSSKALPGSLMSTSSGNISLVGGAASTADAAISGASGGGHPTAVTGLSPPALKPKLGPFVSMRTLRTQATAASFLERLSGSSNLAGPGGHGRVSSRRTIGGGIGGGAGEWAPEGNRQHSFRRREGSYSLDGSGCDVHGDGSGPPQLQIDPAAGRGGGGGSGWAGQAAPGLHARHSYKQLLPRGPNGLPLAWSAIEEDGPEEGSDGGEGGKEEGGKRQPAHAVTDDEGGGRREPGGGRCGRAAAEEGDGDEGDDDDDGFSLLAHGGGWVDLHQTC